MADLFDTTRIPDGDAHWDALADRVAARAARAPTRGGLDWLAHSRAGWVAASLLLAAALAVLMLPAGRPAVAGFADEWARAFEPADAVGQALIRRDAPPAIGVLLLGAAGGA